MPSRVYSCVKVRLEYKIGKKKFINEAKSNYSLCLLNKNTNNITLYYEGNHPDWNSEIELEFKSKAAISNKKNLDGFSIFELNDSSSRIYISVFDK